MGFFKMGPNIPSSGAKKESRRRRERWNGTGRDNASKEKGLIKGSFRGSEVVRKRHR